MAYSYCRSGIRIFPEHDKILPGIRFGRLSVIGTPFMARPGKTASVFVVSKCDCGNIVANRAELLIRGATNSCGCLQRELLSQRRRTHGQSRICGGVGSKAYKCWRSLRDRCQRESHPQYADYGGRGVTVALHWNVFENFLADVGEPPSGKHQLDRYPNNNGNYEPGNVRWATPRENCRNKRNNHIVELNGRRATVAELVEETGIPHRTILHRLEHGWSIDRALTTPVRRYRKQSD